MAPTTSATKTRAGRSVKSKVKPDAHEVPKMAEVVKKVEKRKKKEDKKKPEPKQKENETVSGSAVEDVEMAAADEEEMPEEQPTKAARVKPEVPKMDVVKKVEKRKKKEEKKKPEPKKREDETASGSAAADVDVEMAAADEEMAEQPAKAVRGQKEKKEEKDKKKEAAKRKSEAAEKKKKDEVKQPEAAKRKSGKVSPAPAPQAAAVPILLASSQALSRDEVNKMIVSTFARYSQNELAQRYEKEELSYENYPSDKLLESLIQNEQKGVKEAVAKKSEDAAAFLRLQAELSSVKQELEKEKEEHNVLRVMYGDLERRFEEERRKSNSCSLKR